MNLTQDPRAVSKGFHGALRRRVRVIRPVHSVSDDLIDGMQSLVQSLGLLRAMTITRLKIRYRHSLLGWGWALLQPMSLMVLYSVVFSHLTNGNGSLPYTVFVFAGLTPWAFCSTAITTAVAGILSHRPLMATVYFPREVIPISFVVASLVDFFIAFFVLLFMMKYFSISISTTALLALPIIAILVLMVLALSLLLSSIQVHIRDISVALPLILQVLVFTAPIVYPASSVPAALQNVYWLNPFAILVQGFREAVVYGGIPPAGDLLYCAVVAVIFFVICYLIFKRIERTIVDDM
jgi:lipopolysaccharide transport system permease protein